MAMCDELGPKGDHYMQDYILEAGGTSLCKAEPPYKGCSEKEIKFINKVETLDADKVAAQTERLNKMKGSKMKADLANWLQQRLAILKQFGPKDEL
eukprot:m.34521 g.34521  ORF g.34521 m.34521 type:complete len:96 (+) comp14314_c0_seq1:409-696(+)